MKTTFAVAAAALVGSVAAASNGTASAVYVTEVVTAFTTFCPEATVLTHGSSTYTVTEATTLTISDCPCTITKPVSTAAATAAVSSAVVSSAAVSSAAGSSAAVSSAAGSSAAVSPVAVSSAPYTYSNGTVTSAVSGTAAGTGVASASTTAFTGAAVANKASFGGLAAIMGLAVYAL